MTDLPRRSFLAASAGLGLAWTTPKVRGVRLGETTGTPEPGTTTTTQSTTRVINFAGDFSTFANQGGPNVFSITNVPINLTGLGPSRLNVNVILEAPPPSVVFSGSWFILIEPIGSANLAGAVPAGTPLNPSPSFTLPLDILGGFPYEGVSGTATLFVSQFPSGNDSINGNITGSAIIPI